MRRAYGSLLALLAACACAPQSDGDGIRRAEAKLVLPIHAEPLDSYNRYYAITRNSARGIFIWSPTGKGKLTVIAREKDLPFVADGGCDVVEVELDLKNNLWKRPLCHGP
jgi:hypothetical protein